MGKRGQATFYIIFLNLIFEFLIKFYFLKSSLSPFIGEK